MAPDYSVVLLVLLGTVVGLATALWYSIGIAKVNIEDGDGANARLINNEHKGAADDNVVMSVPQIAAAVSDGANAFLYAEYRWMGVFMSVFGLALLLLLGITTKNWAAAALSCVAFFAGVITSVVCGFIGMRVAVYTNSCTAR